MSIRFTRARAIFGGAFLALTIVVEATSVAWACVATLNYNSKFKETKGDGTANASSGKTGDQLRAVGGPGIEKPSWPYQVKLYPDRWNGTSTEMSSRCGTKGTLQVVTVSSGSPKDQLFTSSFNAPFTLNAVTAEGKPMGPGPAHFCAIAGAERTTSGAVGATEYYIYDNNNNFTITLI